MKIAFIVVVFAALGLSSAAQPLPPPGTRADDGSVIDVLVIYTQNARAIAGGTHPQTITMIDAAIDGVNAALSGSGVLTQLDVIQYQPVFYLEQVNIDFHADLTNLTGTADGYLDDIHVLRDYYAADLVLMVTGTWFYVYSGDSEHTTVPDAAAGFAVWEAKGLDDSGGIFNTQWIARTLGIDDVPPYDAGEAVTMNANRVAVANYRDSATRVSEPVELLHNGGFEIDMDADKVPDFWAASGWGSGDKRACNKPGNVRSGLCSVKLSVGTSGGNMFVQPVDGGPIGLSDSVTLTGYTMTKSGTACVKTTLVMKYVTLPKGKVNEPVCFNASDGWALTTVNIPAADFVDTIKLKVKATSGKKVWLDDFSLIIGLDSPRGGRR